MRSEAPDETRRGWVLVQTDAGAAPAVADALSRLTGVTVERTVGSYDIVAHVNDRSVAGADRVVKTAAALPGVQLAVCCHAAAPAYRPQTRHPSRLRAGHPRRHHSAPA